MEFLKNHSLQTYNSFGFEVSAEFFCEVTELSELREALAFAEQQHLEVLVIGGGSNLILVDNLPGLVIVNRLKGVSFKSVAEDRQSFKVTAAAGENWHGFVRRTLDNNAAGLENLSLIPGTVGAAPMQNIGAYGVEIKDRMLSLKALDRETGDVVEFATSDCEFGYRDSIFKRQMSGRYIILEVTFLLGELNKPVLGYAGLDQQLVKRGISEPTALQISDLVCEIRESKLPDPSVLGNAGSFFKNPVISVEHHQEIKARYPDLVSFQDAGGFKLAAGWLIDQLGWKGRHHGDAAVYDKQALVLVNRGHASGKEVLQLANEIRQDVLLHFGVDLEIEPRTFPE